MTSSLKNFNADNHFFWCSYFSPAPEVKFHHATEQGSPAASGHAPVPSPVDESKPVTSLQIRLADGTR